MLCIIQNLFGIGKITNHGNTTLQYTVKSLVDLQVIISHFDKYPLLSEKLGDYNLFKQGIELIINKAHLNKEGFSKILAIKAGLNLGFSDEFKLLFPYINAVKKPQVSKQNIFNFNWLAGLTSGCASCLCFARSMLRSGKGCFHVSIRNSPTTNLGKSITLKFHIVQHGKDIELIKLLRYTLKCGRIELVLQQSAVYFVVTNFKDIFEKLISLFDNYNIKGFASRRHQKH